jgi:major membrane immunogen (membrane-anchored lipoprotein)
MADRQGQEKEEQDDKYNMAQGASGTHLKLLADKVEDRQDTGNVSTVTVAVNRDAGALLA